MIGYTRKIVRESADVIHSAGRSRAVIVEFDPTKPGLIGFRLKRCRQTYYLPAAWCWRESVRNELARLRAERKRERTKR